MFGRLGDDRQSENVVLFEVKFDSDTGDFVVKELQPDTALGGFSRTHLCTDACYGAPCVCAAASAFSSTCICNALSSEISFLCCNAFVGVVILLPCVALATCSHYQVVQGFIRFRFYIVT